ncbi:uncharacterized protein F4817DRAFT_368143 [Daldinia loculata]|uniref:uncharacterized protein n=1 Tax=Daldinia loculata TaxID=103429 RepID=UPI0020C27D1E|nr:uncharacterized protein F4817DRAFT_368143 [Daldinia loculata]KAI1643783.1 hypothetical protein F4817DRAFT_368143 [Daldinia loculata]
MSSLPSMLWQLTSLNSECIAATVLVRFKPASVVVDDAAIPGKTVSFTEQWQIVSRCSANFQTPMQGTRRTLSPKRIRQEALLTGDLSALELESTYRAYIDCTMARRMETDLHKFVHPHPVFNTKTLTEEDYRQAFFTATPGPRP